MKVKGEAEFDSPVTMASDLLISDKIVHSGDTNTAIRFPSNDVIAFETAGSERARIFNNSNISIFQVNSGGSGAQAHVVINGIRSTDGEIGTLTFYNDSDSVAQIRANRAGANSAADLIFTTQPSGGTVTERMRITSTGTAQFNNTPNLPGFHITSNTPNVRTELGLGTADCPTFGGITAGSSSFTGLTTLEKVRLNANAFETETASFTLAAKHAGAIVFCNNTAPMTITVPLQTSGFTTTFIAKTSNAVSFVADSPNIGLNSFNGAGRLAGFAAQASITYDCPSVAFLGGTLI